MDFFDLLYHDKVLAIDVCNAKRRDENWLRQAANLFCRENGFPTEDASIEFTNMPHRFVTKSLSLVAQVPYRWLALFNVLVHLA